MHHQRHLKRFHTRYLAPMWLLILVTVLPGLTHPIPGPFFDLPGKSMGKMQSRWIAPYIYSSELTMGSQMKSTVTWYDTQGKVLRTVIGGTPQPGFVLSEDCKTVYGLTEGWVVTLPKTAPDVDCYPIGMTGSETFISQLVKGNITTLHVYVHGKPTGVIGPVVNYEGRTAQVSADGSAALLIWENSAKKTAQVIVLGPDGCKRFCVAVDHPIDTPITAPGGAGVLLHSNKGGDDGSRFLWYTAKGKQRSLDIGPNGEFEGWVPGSHYALMSTSIGDEYRYCLVDWDAGKILWDIPIASNGHPLAHTLTSDYGLFAVAELYRPGPWSGESFTLNNHQDEWIQSFYAINLRDGSIAGYWRAHYPRRYSEAIDRGFFNYRGKDLYYVTPREFSLINPTDIRAKQNGWSDPPVQQ